MSVQFDLLVEFNHELLVTAYTRAGEDFMQLYWGAGIQTPSGRLYWRLTNVPFDPLIHRAAMAGLLILVRKARS